jgi:CubicO group peptidase (beta-lactamase class C family)
MDLIERYLQAVKFWLPKKQKDDIIAELSEDLRAQIEERETALGRPLNEAEVEALLKQRGSPFLVANRFLPQESLIGPVLFPIYRFSIKIAVLCYLIPWVLVGLSLTFASPSYRAGRSWLAALGSMSGYLWATAFVVLGTVTIVFAVLERVQARKHFLEDWNPRKLPKLRDPNLIGRGTSGFDLAVNLVLAVWWAANMASLVVVNRPYLRIELAPLWSWFFWSYLVLMLVNTVVAAVNLLRPYWTVSRATLRLLTDCAGAVLFCWLLEAKLVVGFATPNLAPEKGLEIAKAFNLWMDRIFPAAVILGVVIACTDVARILRVKTAKVRLAAPAAVVATLLLLAGGAHGQTPAAASALPSDAELRAILADRIDVQHKSVGMVVGITTPAGRRIVSYGHFNPGDERPLDGDTVFEIGSVTKVFTALVLADMVERGELKLDDPVAKYLPAGVKLPERQGHAITLVDLATQTSGLPFFPSDIPLSDPKEAQRIVAQYTIAQSYQFLSRFELTRDIGTKWEYSNLGFALLGQALAQRAGTDYEALVRARITRPLGMQSTTIAVSPAMQARLAPGHDAKLQPASEIMMPAFLAAGCLRSSANDILTFLDAFLGRKDSPLAPAMKAMLQTRRPGPGFQQALGWWIISMDSADEGFVFHGGETPGYSSSVAYDPKTKTGVVVLSNGAENDGGLGWHLMRPSFPLATSAAQKAIEDKTKKEMALDPKLLGSYAGRYRVASGPTKGDIVAIERTGDFLALKSASTPPQGLRLHAENDHLFFITEADLQIDFRRDGARATSIVIHFAGSETPATRVDEPVR